MHSTKLLLTAALSAAGLGLSALGAAASPAAPNLSETMAAVGAQAKPQSVAYRRCWYDGGSRHCRWVGSRSRGYGYRYYGPLYPEAYRTGSSRWWQEMDRDDRGGRGRP